MGKRREQLLVAGALVAPTLYLLWRTLLSDEALFARDIFHHYWPLRAAVLRAFARGELPLWDGSIHAGVPLLANVHAAALYPFNLIHELFSFPRAYALLVAGHQVLAGAGLYLLLRGWVSRVAAAGGALVFVASGPVVSLFEYGPNLMGLAWLPWALWGLASAGRPAWRVAGVALAVAMQSLAGDPLAVLLTGLAGAAWVGWSERRRTDALVLVTGGGLGLLLAAVQLLPSLALLPETSRSAVDATQAHRWALHPARLVELLVPHPFGWFDSAPAFWGSFVSLGPFPTPLLLSVYLGATTLVLASLGVARSRRAGFAGSLVGLGLVLGLGDQLVAGPLLRSVPPFTFFHSPEKYVVLAGLGVAVLAALGLERVEVPAGRRRWAWAGLAVALGLGGLLLPLAPGAVAALAAGLRGSPKAELVAASLRLAGLLGAAFVGLALALLAVTRRWTLPARQAALVALAVVDLLLANQDAVVTAPALLYEQRPELVDTMTRAAVARPFRYWRDSVALRAPRGTDSESRLKSRAWELLTLKSSLGGLFGLEELSGYTPVVLTRWNTVAVALYEDRPRLHALFNTCFLVTTPASWMSKVVDTALVAPLPMAELRQHGSCAGRVFGVERVARVASLDEAVERLRAPGFDVTREAVAEGAGPLEGLDVVRVESVSQRDGHLTAELDVGPRGGFAVAAVSWARGWTLTLDGAPAPVVVANGAEVGFAVPAGRHHVELDFRQPLLGLGAALSLLAGLGGAGGLLLDWRRRARPRS